MEAPGRNLGVHGGQLGVPEKHLGVSGRHLGVYGGHLGVTGGYPGVLEGIWGYMKGIWRHPEVILWYLEADWGLSLALILIYPASAWPAGNSSEIARNKQNLRFKSCRFTLVGLKFFF